MNKKLNFNYPPAAN